MEIIERVRQAIETTPLEVQPANSDYPVSIDNRDGKMLLALFDANERGDVDAIARAMDDLHGAAE